MKGSCEFRAASFEARAIEVLLVRYSSLAAENLKLMRCE
jgi:hypothetical protein